MEVACLEMPSKSDTTALVAGHAPNNKSFTLLNNASHYIYDLFNRAGIPNSKQDMVLTPWHDRLQDEVCDVMHPKMGIFFRLKTYLIKVVRN
jgi:hypothetical protein